jgi:hypothetical protein
MTEAAVFKSLLVFAVVLILIEVWHRYMSMSPRRRMRFRKSVKCFFGKHELGTPEDIYSVADRRVQRCDWCGRVIREYEVLRGGTGYVETIRRIK